jgi:RNA polymerase sigma-70 factor (ECF subfamily)
MMFEKRAESTERTRDLGSPESDEALYLRYAGGDRSAFDLIVTRHQKFAYHLAFFAGKNRTFAEESVQDAFALLAAAERRFTDQGPGSFKSWFGSIVVNCVRTLARNERAKMNRVQSRKYQDRVREINRPQTAAPNENQPLEDDVRQAIRKTLDGMRDELRLPLMLHFYEGLTQSDISRMVGVSQTVVKRRMTKGLELLRIRLTKQNITLSAALLSQTLAAGDAFAVPETLRSALAQLAANPAAMARRAADAANYSAQSVKAAGGAAAVKWAVVAVAATTAITVGAVWLNRTPTVSKPAEVATVTPSVEQTSGWLYTWDFQDGVPEDLRVVAGQWQRVPATKDLPATMITDTEVFVLLPKKVGSEPFVVEMTVAIDEKPGSWSRVGWSTAREQLGFRLYGRISEKRVDGLSTPLWKQSYFFFGDVVILYHQDGAMSAFEYVNAQSANRVSLGFGQKGRLAEIRMYSLSESEIPKEVQEAKVTFAAGAWSSQSVVSSAAFKPQEAELRSPNSAAQPPAKGANDGKQE